MSGFFWQTWHGDDIIDLVRQAGRDGVSDAAELLLEESNRTVPIEEGTLMRSGTVDVDAAEPAATVSYETPYARRQHEDTRLAHNAGRRAKWLEATFDEQHDRATEVVADRLKSVMS